MPVLVQEKNQSKRGLLFVGLLLEDMSNGSAHEYYNLDNTHSGLRGLVGLAPPPPRSRHAENGVWLVHSFHTPDRQIR